MRASGPSSLPSPPNCALSALPATFWGGKLRHQSVAVADLRSFLRSLEFGSGSLMSQQVRIPLLRTGLDPA